MPEVELIVAGVDSSGGHLFTVSNPGGSAACHDVIGTVAIGSGEAHQASFEVAHVQAGCHRQPGQKRSVWPGGQQPEVACGGRGALVQRRAGSGHTPRSSRRNSRTVTRPHPGSASKAACRAG